MTDLNDHALSLLARTQLGSYLTSDERETVLSALYEVHELRKRAEAAEKKWAQLLEIVNGSPAPAPKEVAPTPAPLLATVQEAGEVASREEIWGVEARDRAPAFDGEAPESPKEASGEEVPPVPPPSPEKRCAGLNKAANVPCNSTRIAVEVNGEHFCMRHAPDRAARLAAKAKAEEAA